MKEASAQPPRPEDSGRLSGPDRPDEPPVLNARWPWRKMFFLIALAMVLHVAMICFFGTKKQIVPRRVTNVPRLQLVGAADPLIALENPALFALPNAKDFGSAVWLGVPRIAPQTFRWNEQPQWLPLDTENLGATLQKFVQTHFVTEQQLDIKPPAEVSPQWPNIGSAMPQTSTLKIPGSLARRVLGGVSDLPSLPYPGAIPASKVQVLVDRAGQVVSAVLLPLTDGMEAAERCDAADQQALKAARQLRFAPAAELTLGEIIFKWHTIPVPVSGTPTTSP